MWRRGLLLLVLLVLVSGVAAADRTAPIALLRVDEVTLEDRDGGGWLNDIVIDVSVELLNGKDALDLQVYLTYPSLNTATAEFLIRHDAGAFNLTLVLLNYATEPGWYTAQIEGSYCGYSTITEPFPFDPEGGSIGPSGL